MIIDSNNPNYRIVKDFFSIDKCNDVLSDANVSEEVWEKDFVASYPREEDVTPDYWMAIKDWKGMSISLTTPKWDEIYGLDRSKYESISKLAQNQIEERFGVKVSQEQYTISRWRVGREQEPHIDYFKDHENNDMGSLYGVGMNDAFIDQFKENFHTKNYSTIIYLNDDFEGGELYFPQYDNLTLKPETGMMICFKGDSHHLHGVKPVQSGIRYTISIFWTQVDE
jgi:hypothetical protein